MNYLLTVYMNIPKYSKKIMTQQELNSGFLSSIVISPYISGFSIGYLGIYKFSTLQVQKGKGVCNFLPLDLYKIIVHSLLYVCLRRYSFASLCVKASHTIIDIWSHNIVIRKIREEHFLLSSRWSRLFFRKKEYRVT